MRTIVTSNKDFILSHLNHFYPLKALPRLSRPRSMKNLAQSQARLCRICGENIGAGTGLPTSTSVTLSVSFHQYSILFRLFIHSSIISPITDTLLHICQQLSAYLSNVPTEISPLTLFLVGRPQGQTLGSSDKKCVDIDFSCFLDVKPFSYL